MSDESGEEVHSKRVLAEKLLTAEDEAREKAINERKTFRGLQVHPSSSIFDDSDKKEPGEGNWSGFGFDIHPHVTFISTAFLIIFITLCLMFQKEASKVFSEALG